MSMMTCLIIFSGSSAWSTRSLRFARMRVDTRSKSAMRILLSRPCSPAPGGSPAAGQKAWPHKLLLSDAFRFRVRLGRLIANGSHFRKQLAHRDPGERFEQRGNLGGHLGDVAG